MKPLFKRRGWGGGHRVGVSTALQCPGVRVWGPSPSVLSNSFNSYVFPIHFEIGKHNCKAMLVRTVWLLTLEQCSCFGSAKKSNVPYWMIRSTHCVGVKEIKLSPLIYNLGNKRRNHKSLGVLDLAPLPHFTVGVSEQCQREKLLRKLVRSIDANKTSVCTNGFFNNTHKRSHVSTEQTVHVLLGNINKQILMKGSLSLCLVMDQCS